MSRPSRTPAYRRARRLQQAAHSALAQLHQADRDDADAGDAVASPRRASPSSLAPPLSPPPFSPPPSPVDGALLAVDDAAAPQSPLRRFSIADRALPPSDAQGEPLLAFSPAAAGLPTSPLESALLLLCCVHAFSSTTQRELAAMGLLAQAHLPHEHPADASVGAAHAQLPSRLTNAYNSLWHIYRYCESCGEPWPGDAQRCVRAACASARHRSFCVRRLELWLREFFCAPGRLQRVQRANDAARARDLAVCAADVYGGALYQHSLQRVPPDSLAVHFAICTDGMQAYKTPSGSLWPVLGVVLELSPEQRYKVRLLDT
jgi:hypothetical protein